MIRHHFGTVFKTHLGDKTKQSMEHFSSHLQSWTLSAMKGFQTEPSKSVSDWLVLGAILKTLLGR